MIHWNDSVVRRHLLSGQFGLERETLRITRDGYLSHTPHPFPETGAITRDFCENQVEVNTAPHDSVEGVLEELADLDRRVRQSLDGLPEPELLWPFSNPPYIRDTDDIPIAQFHGDLREKTLYREYLSQKYGRYIMTFSGIHFNFSFSEDLLRREFELSGEENYYHFKDHFYLGLAKGLMEYGWLLVAATAASPLFDRSYFETGKTGETVFAYHSSYRCSENGYWNDFVPGLDFESLQGYGESIQRYIDAGTLFSASELYYPVRLKSKDGNNMHTLMERGVSHIEFRLLDLNPLAPLLIDERDLRFAHLLMVWAAAQDLPSFAECDQIRAVANFKRSAIYDLSGVAYIDHEGNAASMDLAGAALLKKMQEDLPDLPPAYAEALTFELEKFEDPSKRYAVQIREQFSDDFVRKGLDLAEKQQQI